MTKEHHVGILVTKKSLKQPAVAMDRGLTVD